MYKGEGEEPAAFEYKNSIVAQLEHKKYLEEQA